MKLSSVTLFAVLASSKAFTGPSSTGRQLESPTSISLQKKDSCNDEIETSRRSVLLSTATATMGLIFTPNQAYAGLLDEFGTDPVKIKETPPPPPTSATATRKSESNIEPNLRSNYYYPTNKKRYLPRIKKCNDAIPLVADSIGSGDWEAVSDFALKVADDTILPMKLYTSSLTGGGTNVKVSFTTDMMKAADDFEKSQKAMVKAIKKKDQVASSTALEGMASALLSYRTAGRLLGPDGGGDIPSVDDIRRSACRVQGRSFEKRVKDRDERLRQLEQ